MGTDKVMETLKADVRAIINEISAIKGSEEKMFSKLDDITENLFKVTLSLERTTSALEGHIQIFNNSIEQLKKDQNAVGDMARKNSAEIASINKKLAHIEGAATLGKWLWGVLWAVCSALVGFTAWIMKGLP